MGDAMADLSYSSGAPVRYTEVAEFQKDMGVQSGKTAYYYDKSNNGFNPVYFKLTGDNKSTDMVVRLSDWHIGTLDSVAYFKYTGSGYDTVMKKKYTYTKFELEEQVRVGLVFSKTVFEVLSGGLGDETYSSDDFETLVYGKTVGIMLLTSEEEKWKEGNTRLVKNTNYYYDNLGKHLQPTRTTVSVSGGKTVTNYVSYAQDYVPNSDFIASMVANHMVSSR